MSEIKYVGETWIAQCNQLTSQPFKGLISLVKCNQCQLERDMTDTRHSLVTTQSITEYLQLHDYSSMGHEP